MTDSRIEITIVFDKPLADPINAARAIATTINRAAFGGAIPWRTTALDGSTARIINVEPKT